MMDYEIKRQIVDVCHSMHKNGARCSLQYQPKQAEIGPNFVYHAQPPVAQCPFDPGIIAFI